MIQFIEDSANSAFFNMAADQYLLRRCTDTETVFIRFYSWNEPSITLGYMQNSHDVLDFQKIREDNVSWIKRPTGGRAVLHFEDVTYSCIFSRTLRSMGSSVQESYHIITRCLIEGFKNLGINCQAHDSYDEFLELKREAKLPCFLAPNRDEIMVEGKKLVGSAQRRTTTGVLQHGSIPLTGFYRKLPDYLKISEKERWLQKRLLQEKSVSLKDLKVDTSIGTIVAALKAGFIKKLAMPSETKGWSNNEMREIAKCIQSESEI